MARLFISYKREERSHAFAVRQWLIDKQGWRPEDIFVDVDHVRAGDEWERKILAEAEAAEAILFLASEHSLDVRSFCYRELQHANGQILAVTIKGVQPDDERLQRAIPQRAKSRQIAALDREPTRPFPFVSPLDHTNGSAQLNEREVENIARILRDDFGIAPDSFSWAPPMVPIRASARLRKVRRRCCLAAPSRSAMRSRRLRICARPSPGAPS